MAEQYKYESLTPPQYNLTTKLVDEMVEKGLGDKVLVYYQDKTYTYRDIQSMVNKAGNALRTLGVQIEGRVMLVMYDSPEAMASFFGAVKIGAIPVPVNYMFTRHDYRYLLNNSRARTLIADADFIEEIEGFSDSFLYLKNTIVVGETSKPHHIGFHDLISRSSDELAAAYTTSDDAAFWNYTSGSTGTPKAAVHLQHDAFTCIDGFARATLGITGDDIIFSASKFFFSYGLGNSFFFPLGTGAAVVLLPDRPLPGTVLATIERYRPTIFCGIPTLYANILQTEDAEKYDLSSLRICISAGESLPRDIFFRWKERFGIEILEHIGSTEMVQAFISNRPGDVKPGSTGKVVPGYSVRIVDDSGNDVPDGEIGSILVKGDSAAAYYYRNHEKTKASMLGEWFRTGDQFYKDAEGYYYYCGRDDDMLKVGGIWVSPIEVEDSLISHPAVLEAAVVAKNDERDLVKPKAFIVLKKDYAPSEELSKDIQDFVKKNLAPYKYPRWVEFVNDLPKTATGKIQRYKLRE